MAKVAGLNHRFLVQGYQIDNDVSAINGASTPRGIIDVPTLSNSAMERVIGTSDGALDFNVWFNDAAAREHIALRGMPSTDISAMWCLGALTAGDKVFMMIAKEMDYQWSRTADGSLSGSVQLLSNATPGEWGILAFSGTHSGAANAASIDLGAATSKGITAYAHVGAFSGSNVTVKIQGSSDNGSGDAFADKLSFDAFEAGYGSQRKLVTGAVERYARVVTTGTFSSAVITVGLRVGLAEDDVDGS